MAVASGFCKHYRMKPNAVDVEFFSLRMISSRPIHWFIRLEESANPTGIPPYWKGRVYAVSEHADREMKLRRSALGAERHVV